MQHLSAYDRRILREHGIDADMEDSYRRFAERYTKMLAYLRLVEQWRAAHPDAGRGMPSGAFTGLTAWAYIRQRPQRRPANIIMERGAES